MSYPPYQGNQPYGAPPQGHSPHPGYNQGPPPPPQQGHSPYPQQQGYGGPPPLHSQYPPQGQYPPPGQGGYGAQAQGGYGQQGYPPQQGFPPHQQQYGQPPQGGYPPQPHFQQPPPQQGYNQQQYGQPPQGQNQAYPPPGGQYGGQQQQQQQQWGAPPMATLPSRGYGPLTVPAIDATSTADGLRKAFKGFGTDEAAVVRLLCHYPAEHIAGLKTAYQQRHHRSLESDIASETSGYFEDALLAILRGPLQQDVYTLNKAIKGVGTNEDLLNDVLLGRSNADLNAIKHAYQAMYHRTLEADVAGDLSSKTQRLFSMVLAATRQEESAPVIPQNVEQDVTELHRATEGKLGTDQLTVCSILSNRSDGQNRAIAAAYEARYRVALEKVMASEFAGHMKDALVQMVRCGTDRAMRDAIRLEDCMAGPGTKDEKLVARVVSIHWDRAHMGQVRGAYKHKYKKELVARIKGETSGYYERILVAMVE